MTPRLAALSLACLTLLMPLLPAPGNAAASGHAHDAAPETSPEAALQSLRDAVAFMEQAVQEDIDALFVDGPVMERLHEQSMRMDAATERLQAHAGTLDAARRARLQAALDRLNATWHEFHTATHEQDAAQTRALLKKTKAALALVEAYMK